MQNPPEGRRDFSWETRVRGSPELPQNQTRRQEDFLQRADSRRFRPPPDGFRNPTEKRCVVFRLCLLLRAPPREGFWGGTRRSSGGVT